ncbi:MAG TPA: tetratricopeptide repeat protein [Longimicrobiales bacterium]|nr:tetratricopeptide repeat protein [Longimicrobiales bacterium]
MAEHRRRRGYPGLRGVARPLGAAAGLALLLGACAGGESALARGDRLWADSNYAGALAEYRLSMEQGGDATVLARVAHAYAVTGQFERARESYEQLLRTAPEYTDQAVFDYLGLARRALERSDRYGMAGAVQAALALRPGLPLAGLTGPLARYYATSGDTDRAVEFYERALSTVAPDSVADLLFELAEIQEARGSCGEAIELFGAYRTRVRSGERRDQARFRIANCSFTLAVEARQGGQHERALALLGTVIELGVPVNLQDDAWYERGEALLASGRPEEALDAYYRVLELSPARRGQLAERAQQRIDEIRFGRVQPPGAAEPEPGAPGT